MRTLCAILIGLCCAGYGFAAGVPRVLAMKCAKCHGAGAAMSDFDLTTRDALLKGGKHGVDVVPGKPAESRLYQWISEGRMPPDGKLAAAEIEAVREWIADGAQGSVGKDRKSTRLNSSHIQKSRMPSSA